MSYELRKVELYLELRRLREAYLTEVLRVQNELDRLEALDATERLYPAAGKTAATADEKGSSGSFALPVERRIR